MILLADPPDSHGATLRLSGNPSDRSFAKMPHELDANGSEPRGSLALFVDGRDTGIRVPMGYRAAVRSNRRGDLAGSLDYTFSGAYSGRVSRTFSKPRRGRWRLLPVPKDLGVFDTAAFASDGSIAGSLWVDGKGQPVNGIMQEMPGWHRVAVRWQDGSRTLTLSSGGVR